MIQRYRFKDYVFSDHRFTPYYDAYKGHKFIVNDYRRHEDPEHVFLLCVTDPNLEVRGAVHWVDLEECEK